MMVVACGSPPKPRPVKVVATVSARCPDLAKADELAAFDFAKEYQLSRDAADKLKAAALAALEVTQLADKLDAELGIACSQVANDLGSSGDWRSGNDACGAAIKAVHEAREKLGAKAAVKLVVRSPVCSTDATLMTKCASICDSSVPSDRVKADCSEKVGRCDGNCGGICEAKTAFKCEGTCSGTCDGPIDGTCGGRCKGKCDGKRSSGPCLGVCVGRCDEAAVDGECKGLCSGSCKLTAPGICAGLCAGTCTVELADEKCAGEFKTPDVSTDCRARCELAAINSTVCSTPHVGIVIAGAATRERSTADTLKSSVDKSYPGLLKILFEVGDEGPSRVLNAQAVIGGARKGFRDMARSGGAATAPASEAQLSKCFDEAFKKAESSAASVKAGLDQARVVREEAAK